MTPLSDKPSSLRFEEHLHADHITVHGRKRRDCDHPHVSVCTDDRTVTCVDCGDAVDPVSWIIEQGYRTRRERQIAECAWVYECAQRSQTVKDAQGRGHSYKARWIVAEFEAARAIRVAVAAIDLLESYKITDGVKHLREQLASPMVGPTVVE